MPPGVTRPPVETSDRVNNRGTKAVDHGYEPPQPTAFPEVTTSQGKLSGDETAFILRTCLLPEHADDPNILRFISNYMVCRDSRQAAKEAGLPPRAGVNLRARPDIHKAIEALTQKSVMKYGFDASEVIEKVKEVAAVDPVEFINPDGSYKTRMEDIAPEARRAIKKFKAKNLFDTDPNGMKTVVGVLIEVELWDKMKAVELLGREKDIFKETRKVQHDVTSNMRDVLLEAKNRADRRFNEIHDREAPLEITGRVVTDET